jgi:transposase
VFFQVLKMGWLLPFPWTALQCAKMVVCRPSNGEDGKMKDTMMGADLAKSIFQVHGASMSGQVQFRKRLTRPQFRKFMAERAPAVVVMEACGSSHYWAREMIKLGHEVKLIAPQYVKPFVKRQKNDAADAEAIVIAAQRPEMRFVDPKSEGQQARAVLFRGRERLVRQRTELVNALRSVLYEYGHTAPQGIRQLKRIEAIVEEPSSDLPALVREECHDLIEQIAEKTARIDTKTKKAVKPATQTDTARRLQTMPGVGPLTALAIEAFAPEMESFGCGRDFAASCCKHASGVTLGLVPRQHSSGGKERLGRVSKAGQADIRRLLIIGAMSRLNWMGRQSIPEGSWLARLSARKPKMLVAIASANKMARAIWAMSTKQKDYRDPMSVVAA